MLDRKKDEESARPAPETAPDNDDLRGAAEPAYVPTPATPKPPAPGLPGMPAIPRLIADIPPISRPAGDGAVSRSENTRLSVGKDVEMSGEIKSCDLLVVEGTVDANLQNGREIQVARGGWFSGLVEVEDADISGEFSGKLVVRKRLIVRTGGKVDGEIFYGEIKVEPGGEVSGRLAAGDGHATEIAVAVEARRAEEHELGTDDGDGADGLTEPGVSET